jgi:hypothetical protein
MRIWDLPPSVLCRQHLLAEHRELHGLWNILVFNKLGYSHHPETLRWVGKLGALFKRHEMLVKEMKCREYKHHTPLDAWRATDSKEVQTDFVESVNSQVEKLKKKGCKCKV